ncbi:MAG: serine hydrolase [Planctomycetota bacterium]|nr:serine hydrolase [Planctomycetota bacterium]
MNLKQTIRRALAVLCAVVAMSPSASAQAQTDITTPTAWVWLTNATDVEVTAQVNAGYRVVDIEVDTASPLRFTAAFVRNTGEYAKGWWWYFNLTPADVSNFLNQNNARLIDLEPYMTSAGLRYAVVMIPNTGADYASDHWWRTSMTSSQVVAWVNANPTRRILDIQSYWDGSETRYAFVWITNTGVHQTGWWFYMGVSSSVIDNFLSQNNARLIDLERAPVGGGYSAVMVPGDGDATYHLYGLTLSQVGLYVSQFAARIIDVERYEVFNGPRFVITMRQNDNDLAIEANHAMRDHLPLSASSGLSLARLDHGHVVSAGVQEDIVFEPASLMKTAYLYTAMRRIALGSDSLANPIGVYTGLNGSCPDGTSLVIRTYGAALARMMELSSNTDTEAVRARIGTANIEAHAHSIGATGIQIRHTIGCLCGSPRNQSTLIDFGRIHSHVALGNLGPLEDDFYDSMLNGPQFGSSGYNTQSVLNNLVANSPLHSSEKAAFLAGIEYAHKGGSYTCNSGPEHHRSIGAYVRIPFRNGCSTSVREYFIGAWVNDASTGTNADNSIGAGVTTLWSALVQDALDSWENANCDPFVNFCTSVPNSTGLSGVASATGNQYISSNDFTMHASGLPQDVFTFMLVGTSSTFLQNPGGSLGNLCVGGTLGRYWDALQSTGSTGTATHPVNLLAIPKPNSAPVPVQSGETLHFQWWHRDTVNNLPASNFTDGLMVTFL